jgi:octaprenyl-diphosphate synthase
MVEFQQEEHFAIRKLHHSDFKEALILMVNYVIERKKKLLMS